MLVIVLIDIDDRVPEAIEGDVIEDLHLVLGEDIVIGEDLVHPLLVYPGVQGEEGEEVLLGEVVKAAIEVVEVKHKTMSDISSRDYDSFLSDIKRFIPSDRIYTDELRTLGWGTDASFYRQIPKIVIRSDGEQEVSHIVRTCKKHQLPFTFRVLTHDEAASLYTGMMTDTGAFTYASTRPEIFELISILLQFGIDKDKIYRNIFFTYSPNRMKLMGYMLYVKLDVWKKAHTSIMTLTNAERRRFGVLNGDTEGLVNLPLQILGMKLSVFLREDTEHPCIRVSLRSVDDFPCNEMAAEFFGGGGHKNAAGGEVWGTMDEALALVKKAVQKYLPLLKE